MDVQETLHGFQLHNDEIVHDEVQPVGTRHVQFAVVDIEWNLGGNGVPGLLKVLMSNMVLPRCRKAGALKLLSVLPATDVIRKPEKKFKSRLAKRRNSVPVNI